MTRGQKLRGLLYGVIGLGLIAWGILVSNEVWPIALGAVGGILYATSYWMYWRYIIWRKRLKNT